MRSVMNELHTPPFYTKKTTGCHADNMKKKLSLGIKSGKHMGYSLTWPKNGQQSDLF